MSVFDLIDKHVTNVFLKAKWGAVDIVYTPVGRGPRAIKAQEFREERTPRYDWPTDRGDKLELSIYIADNDTEGVSEVTDEEDSFTFNGVNYAVARHTSTNEGMWHIFGERVERQSVGVSHTVNHD